MKLLAEPFASLWAQQDILSAEALQGEVRELKAGAPCVPRSRAGAISSRFTAV